MSNSWRDDPNLQKHFHPDTPDDLQVIVHDGGPRLTDTVPELMWVKVVEKSGIAYVGAILNEPQNLKTVRLNDTILFLALPKAQHPFRVTEKYLAEREAWSIKPCNKCGLPELFDAPSDLTVAIFPALKSGDIVATFTTFCPLCGGVQVVDLKEKSALCKTETSRKWWQFWR